MKKMILLGSLLVAGSIYSMNKVIVLKEKSVFAPGIMGNVEVIHDHNGFSVVKNGKIFPVKRQWIEKQLRSLSPEQIKQFQNAQGYFLVNQLDNGDFTLKSSMRGIGGGPASAWWAYNITKGLCYGAAATAVSATVISTGGAILGAAATKGLIASTGLATGKASVAVAAKLATMQGIGGGATAALTQAALGSSITATTVTTEVVATTVAQTGGWASAAGLVEVISCTVGALFAGPWCP